MFEQGLFTLVIFGSSFGLVFSLVLLYVSLARKTEVSEKFFKLLDKKFDLEIVNDRSDVIILAESFTRGTLTSYSLTSLFEDYLEYLVKNSENGIDGSQAKERYLKVKQMLDKENEEKPFANVPDEERRLLLSLKNSIKNNDVESTNGALDDLKLLIATRAKAHIFNKKINIWSIPLAIFGLVASLYFGFVGMKNTVDYDRIQEIIGNTLNKDSANDD
ncbi:MAG: hypothetical protein HY445_00620 [Candidatus Niyogibacteria bacterium]|nr:hypothetical protein [Candidatus Niyogibacteria bacterium]